VRENQVAVAAREFILATGNEFLGYGQHGAKQGLKRGRWQRGAVYRGP